MIKIRLVYRNYKPLHAAYQSLVNNPPKGVEFIVPSTRSRLSKFYKYYRRYRFLPLVPKLIKLVEGKFFAAKHSAETADLYQYLNMVDDNPPESPYIVDTEHAAGLVSFTNDPSAITRAKKFLINPNCRAITCWSLAAQKTLQGLLADDYRLVADKVHVVYPARQSNAGLKPDYEYLAKSSSTLQLLLVGNQAYLKGTEELLEAVSRLNESYGVDKLILHIISNDATEVVAKYNLPNVRLHAPSFNASEIAQKFYMPADLFVMPTKQDTFGMAILDSLAAATPVVTTRQFASPEMIDDGKDGLLLELKHAVMDSYVIPDKDAMDSVAKPNRSEDLTKQLVEVLSQVLDGKHDLAKMGERGRQKFEDGGKFSISKRNQAWLDLYNKIKLT